MIITDFNRCKGCRHYTNVTRATSVCMQECGRIPYEKSNLLRFTSRDRFGSVEYRLDLRGITTMLNTSEQNRLIHYITLADHPETILQQWLDYVEWIHEHEREDMPGGILRRITTLRHRLIRQKERIEQDAGR